MGEKTDRQTDRQADSALKARCTWCCTWRKTQMQQQQKATCSSSSGSKTKNTIVKEGTWFILVANDIVLHPLHLGTGALLTMSASV